MIATFDFEQVRQNIIKVCQKRALHTAKVCYYVVLILPNITYGRKVGYKIEQEHFDEKVENISAEAFRRKWV